jgi:hypothetical protein
VEIASPFFSVCLSWRRVNGSCSLHLNLHYLSPAQPVPAYRYLARVLREELPKAIQFLPLLSPPHTHFQRASPSFERLRARCRICGRTSSDMEAANLKQQQDEGKLGELGYKQELRRDWSLMHNFGVSFSIIVSNFQSWARYCLHSLYCLFRFTRVIDSLDNLNLVS